MERAMVTTWIPHLWYNKVYLDLDHTAWPFILSYETLVSKLIAYQTKLILDTD